MNEVRALVEAFDAAQARGERCAMATIVGVEGSSYRMPGARMLVCDSGSTTGTISAGCLEGDVVEHAKLVLRSGAGKLVVYDNRSGSEEMVWGLGLGCNGIVSVLIEPLAAVSAHIEALRRSLEGPVTVELRAPSGATVLVETLLPPVPLVVFGAGADVLPVVELARRAGWQTEVVDPQARPASRSRFAVADAIKLARPGEIAGRVVVTPRTVALVMSHNYKHDVAMLGFLLASPARYIGVMGPRQRTERMLRDLGAGSGELARVHAPVGLDIGADGPQQIALSIVAEISAVLQRRGGGMLRERGEAIHGGCDEGVRLASTKGVVVAA